MRHLDLRILLHLHPLLSVLKQLHLPRLVSILHKQPMPLALLIVVTIRRIRRRGGGRDDLAQYFIWPVVTTFLRQSHLMLEVDLL
jgi:hypothetical protein